LKTFDLRDSTATETLWHLYLSEAHQTTRRHALFPGFPKEKSFSSEGKAGLSVLLLLEMVICLKPSRNCSQFEILLEHRVESQVT
jgi:hypothetical protein